LGSAEKRLAEVYLRRWLIEGESALRSEEMEALRRSFEHYRKSFRHNLSHHWTGVQMLSLGAVTGKGPEHQYWYAAVAAAEAALDDEREYWAAGSLLELHLLGARDKEDVRRHGKLDQGRHEELDPFLVRGGPEGGQIDRRFSAV
jgi:hypothetical protein